MRPKVDDDELDLRLVFLRLKRPERDLLADDLRRADVALDAAFEVDVRSAALMRMPPFLALADFGASKRGSTRPFKLRPLPDLFFKDANATHPTQTPTHFRLRCSVPVVA
ncbi:MAG: hypothetical protein AAF737_00265 [Pseudomonadota bacterium]